MDTALIQMDALMERLEHDTELVKEIFGVFLEETPGRLTRFAAALSAVDFPAMVHQAHSLKGTSGTLQAEPLRAACLALEAASRNADEAAMRQAYPAVIDLLRRTDARIRELLEAMS